MGQGSAPCVKGDVVPSALARPTSCRLHTRGRIRERSLFVGARDRGSSGLHSRALRN